jgi:hypothetical protein
MHDRAATQVEEEEHEDLTKPNVERLHEIAGPSHVIPQKRGPVLSVASRPSTAHVPLNRPLTHPDAQFEQLAANPLGTPERISHCHFTEQGGTRGRWSTKSPRSSSPQGVKSRPVPAQHGRGLDQQSCLAPSWRNAGREQDAQALPWTPADTTGDLALGNDELLPEEHILSEQSNTAAN